MFIMYQVRLCLCLAFIYIVYVFPKVLGHGVEAIPERAFLEYYNEKYLSDAILNVRRNGRRGGYVINFWAINKQTWDNNVTIDVVFYEYLHNEYKRSFVEMHFKFCDLVNKDNFVGPVLRNHGCKCPVDKGPVGILNSTMKFPKFPYVFPFQKCKADIVVRTEPSHDIIERALLYLNFVEYKDKAKNKTTQT